MRVYYLEEVIEFLEKAEKSDRVRVDRTRKLFERYGFAIGPKYIKKVKSSLWELKAGRIRLFLYITRERAVGVHIIRKKSQKLPIKDIKLAEKRSKEI